MNLAFGVRVKRQPILKFSLTPPITFILYPLAGQGFHNVDGSFDVLHAPCGIAEEVVMRAHGTEVYGAVSVPVEPVVDERRAAVPPCVVGRHEHGVHVNRFRCAVAVVCHDVRFSCLQCTAVEVYYVNVFRYLFVYAASRVVRYHSCKIARRAFPREVIHFILTSSYVVGQLFA